MTEYTTSSQTIREYMNSRERTAYWVETNGTEFLSPSAPPSDLDGWVPPSPVSEAESSHSEPPHMILRYGNGVEVPIPNSAGSGSGSRSSGSRHRRRDSRSRSPTSPIPARSSSSRRHVMPGPHSSSPLAHSGPYGTTNQALPAPEEIRVLPSADPQPSSSNVNEPRSKSLPRSIEHPIRHDPVRGLSANPRIRTPYPGAGSPTAHVPLPPLQVPAQPAPYAPQPPPWHSYSQARAPPHLHRPPAIIYAPSYTSSRPHYAPPAIYHYPPPTGPNGMTYSHSAPVGSQYPRSAVPPATTLPYAFTEEVRGTTWNGHSNNRGYGQSSRSGGPPPLSRSLSSESLDTSVSEGTYYVLPSAGQKIHVLPPSPQFSIGTATSTTRSAHSPHSHTKKPTLFKRLLSFTGRFSRGEHRRVERRHSISGADQRSNFSQH